MNERDEADNDLFGIIYGVTDNPDWAVSEVHDAILAAGYRKPRTITTAEELDALPKDSVVLSGGVVPRIKASGNRWLGEVIDVDSEHIIRWTNYATVLHDPEAAK